MGLLGDLISAKVDALTVTVAAEGKPGGLGDLLLARSEHERAGGSQPGFASSEQRIVLGGKCWRKMEPYQRSKRFGSEYESWEFMGEAAASAAAMLGGRGGAKATRVDVAFDFSVTDHVKSDTFLEAVRPWIESNTKYTLGISGHAGINTQYVGAASSEKRLRIYRKDLEDEAFAELCSAVLRVELVMRRDVAVRWWQLWERDADEAKRAASSMIESMIGVRMVEGEAALPELELPEVAEPGQMVATFVRQNGPMVRALADAGVDLLALSREQRPANRMAESRERRRVQAIVQAGPSAVEQMARALLNRGAVA